MQGKIQKNPFFTDQKNLFVSISKKAVTNWNKNLANLSIFPIYDQERKMNGYLTSDKMGAITDRKLREKAADKEVPTQKDLFKKERVRIYEGKKNQIDYD